MDWKERADAVESRLRNQLLAGLRGDAMAYQLFLAALGSHLRAFFRKRLSAWPDEVEDLVQETMIAVHTCRHTYRAAQPLTSWLHTIARYKYVDFLRARSRREALHDPLDDDAALFAAAATDASDARRDLQTLLATLPAKQREAIRLMKVEGASAAEAGVALGMSEVAVKVSVHRALKALSARFRDVP
jgi:RNA polymerase sigma-70 factor (ECF subfamily)